MYLIYESYKILIPMDGNFDLKININLYPGPLYCLADLFECLSESNLQFLMLPR